MGNFRVWDWLLHHTWLVIYWPTVQESQIFVLKKPLTTLESWPLHLSDLNTWHSHGSGTWGTFPTKIQICAFYFNSLSLNLLLLILFLPAWVLLSQVVFRGSDHSSQLDWSVLDQFSVSVNDRRWSDVRKTKVAEANFSLWWNFVSPLMSDLIQCCGENWISQEISLATLP